MYTISREIGIDAGHRVPTHGSKCKNLHGHRYTIQAICESGKLHKSGEQKDMTIDFSFLKHVMMKEIDTPCDHGLILYGGDMLIETFVPQEADRDSIDRVLQRKGHCSVTYADGLVSGIGKLYLIPEIPTAEVLAKHWFGRLKQGVSERSGGLAWLKGVKVWETPNCWAIYQENTSWQDPDTTQEGP